MDKKSKFMDKFGYHASGKTDTLYFLESMEDMVTYLTEGCDATIPEAAWELGSALNTAIDNVRFTQMERGRKKKKKSKK